LLSSAPIDERSKDIMTMTCDQIGALVIRVQNTRFATHAA